MKNTVEKLSVAEGMQELKRIDKLLNTKYGLIARYASKKKGDPDEVVNQKDYIKEQEQSARDLLERYKRIKLAIQLSNLTNTFEFNGKSYSIAEAILYKQYLQEKFSGLLNAFNDARAQLRLSEFGRYISAMKDQTAESLAQMNLVPELFYDAKKVQAERESLADFMAKMNVLIDKNNHTATIEV